MQNNIFVFKYLIPWLSAGFLFSLTLFGIHDKMHIMKRLLVAFLSLFVVASANAYIDRENATLRIMNKAAGKVQTLVVPLNTPTQFEKLNIVARACKQTDPFDALDYFVFLEISTADDGRVFGGWMGHNAPGDNPLQHPDYDVWLEKCE